MTDDEFKMTWDLILSICRTAQLIPTETVQTLLDTVSQAESIGPLIEPTMYINGGRENLRQQREIGAAFLVLRKAIDSVAIRTKDSPR